MLYQLNWDASATHPKLQDRTREHSKTQIIEKIIGKCTLSAYLQIKKLIVSYGYKCANASDNACVRGHSEAYKRASGVRGADAMHIFSRAPHAATPAEAVQWLRRAPAVAPKSMRSHAGSPGHTGVRSAQHAPMQLNPYAAFPPRSRAPLCN